MSDGAHLTLGRTASRRSSMASGEVMSSPSAVEGRPAAWDHGLTPFIVRRLRFLIPTWEGQHERLYKKRPAEWGDVLARYAVFQRLRRREDESEADHRERQIRWLGARRAWEREHHHLADNIRTAWPDDPDNGPFIPLGTSIAPPEQIAGSELEYTVPISPTGRVLVLDIASDKKLLMARISELIDIERQAAGIPAASRRGPKSRADKKVEAMRRIWPKLIDHARCEAGLQPGLPYPDFDWRPDPDNTEHGEFLKSIQDHRIVPLWDLQLAGLATDKLATAGVLYPERTNPARRVSQRSIPRGLLQKIERARELQEQTVGWLPRLRAVVG
jgi:uncharacterized protein YndB with AHSA1/START domain